MNTLAKNLKHLRKENFCTQQFIASNLNLTQQAYARYESGEAEPTIETLISLSKLFSISVDKLIGKEEDLQGHDIAPIVAKNVWLNTLSDMQKKIIDYVLKLNELNQYKTMTYLYALCEN